MISNIKKIKGLGTFYDFDGTSLPPFSKFNLFYGWNGSGKTTLSRLFYGLGKDGGSYSDFPELEFSIGIKDSVDINSVNHKENLIDIQVFNENFIKKNINWDELVKSLLIISETKIKEKDELIEKEKELVGLNKKISKELIPGIQLLQKEIENGIKEEAKNIKDKFKIIDTGDTYYFNYDKGKLSKFIEHNKEKSLVITNILPDHEVFSLTEMIKPSDKTRIEVALKKQDVKVWIETENRLNILLEKKISSGVINRLKDNSDISSWIEEGLKIHEKHGDKVCEFCGNQIDIKLLLRLKGHFNDELNDLREELKKAEEWIGTTLKIEDISIEKTLFYKDLQKEYEDKKMLFKTASKSLNNFLESWSDAIKLKILNPTAQIKPRDPFTENLILEYNETLLSISSIIEMHNDRIKNYVSELKKNQETLELHYITTFQKNFRYSKKLEKLRVLNEELEKSKNVDLKILESDIQALISDLSNEVFGGDLFNQELEKFLGHGEIKLKFDLERGGYKIIRTHTGKNAIHLSEGEQTAISFVYFIVKLKEKTDLSNTIVIIDDPISSFDSNNIFNAYSYIKTKLTNAKQIFILTHNFSFFRLIKEWFRDKNKKDKPIQSTFLQVEIDPSIPRKSLIRKADDTLINYESEYHFVFKKITEYIEGSSLSLEKAFQLANLSRKLLESFLAFKFPKNKGNFKNLLECGIPDPTINNRIYNFINKYSHLEVIDFSDDSENTQIGEAGNITIEILRAIKSNDSNHYSEMLGICGVKDPIK